MSSITLQGCTSEPLLSYLSSLAVLRLISEQKDPDARGWWENGIFHLDSNLDETDLVQFFIEEYSPTPIVAPWNGGSGFYEGDKTEGIDAIRSSISPRFVLYRQTLEKISSFEEMPPLGQTIEVILSVLTQEAEKKRGQAKEGLTQAVSDVRSIIEPIRAIMAPEDPLNFSLDQLEKRSVSSKKATLADKEKAKAIKSMLKPGKKALTLVKRLRRGAEKEKIIQACRDRLHESVSEWIDAAAVISPEGDAEYPPILGSGGNEGRLDYTNTFMSNLADLLLLPDNEGRSRKLIHNALFSEATDGLSVSKVGQYDPGRAGGYNQGEGVERKDFPSNPWKFVLAMEGCLAWASGVSRRYSSEHGFLRSPFTVRASPVGYSSCSENDGQKARAEIWAPLWKLPVGYPELHTFLSEGHADVGRKTAKNGIEFAEAVASLGIDRGISEFVRYSLLKRRGDNYVALPTGRFSVHARSESDLVRELDPILMRLDQFLRGFDKHIPASFASARRCIDEAIFKLLEIGGADQVKDLLMALGKIEQLIAQRDRSKKPKLNSPLSGLSPIWLEAADDGSVEIRIAAALASIGKSGEVGPIRANLSPVDPAKPWAWAKGQGQLAWIGNSLSARMDSVLARRMMDSQRLNCDSNPLWGSIPIRAEDAVTLIEGNVEEDIIQNLVYGLTWIRWDDSQTVQEARDRLMVNWSEPVADRIIPRPFALLKLLFLPEPLKTTSGEKISVRPEASIVPLLNSGRIGEACKMAQRRLYASGLSPVRSQFPDIGNGERIAAALLLPIQRYRTVAGLVLQKDNYKD
jgi:CRISPR-associated protein Csx17